jgi:hypothetical protein
MFSSKLLSSSAATPTINLPLYGTKSNFISKGESAACSNPGEEAVLLFDLDRCAVLGSDGNDLGIAMQWTNQSHATLTRLYSLLLNPCLSEAFAALRPRYARVHVVLYTARAMLLRLRRPGAAEVPVPWDPASLDGAGQLYVASSTADAAAVMAGSAAGLAGLRAEERDVLQRAMERLFATRDAVRDALGLAAAPDVVVTATPKDPARTAARLGHPAAHAHLWDDNEALRDHPGVVVVPPFLRLAPAQRRRLLAFLDSALPAPALPPDLAAFMLGAHPQHRSLARGPSGRLEYRVPEGADPGSFGAQEPWPLPPPPTAQPALAPARLASSDSLEDGSCVTPPRESTPPPAGAQACRAG